MSASCTCSFCGEPDLPLEQALDEETMTAALTAIRGQVLKVDHTFKLPKVELLSASLLVSSSNSGMSMILPAATGS